MKRENKENPQIATLEQLLKTMESAEGQIKKLEEQYTALKSGCQIEFRLVHDAEDQHVTMLTTGP